MFSKVYKPLYNQANQQIGLTVENQKRVNLSKYNQGGSKAAAAEQPQRSSRAAMRRLLGGVENSHSCFQYGMGVRRDIKSHV